MPILHSTVFRPLGTRWKRSQEMFMFFSNYKAERHSMVLSNSLPSATSPRGSNFHSGTNQHNEQRSRIGQTNDQSNIDVDGRELRPSSTLPESDANRSFLVILQQNLFSHFPVLGRRTASDHEKKNLGLDHPLLFTDIPKIFVGQMIFVRTPKLVIDWGIAIIPSIDHDGPTIRDGKILTALGARILFSPPFSHKYSFEPRRFHHDRSRHLYCHRFVSRLEPAAAWFRCSAPSQIFRTFQLRNPKRLLDGHPAKSNRCPPSNSPRPIGS